MEAPVWRTQAILHTEALCASSWKPLRGGPRPFSSQRHGAPSSCYDTGGARSLKVGCQSCEQKKNNIIRKSRAQVISHFVFSRFCNVFHCALSGAILLQAKAVPCMQTRGVYQYRVYSQMHSSQDCSFQIIITVNENLNEYLLTMGFI